MNWRALSEVCFKISVVFEHGGVTEKPKKTRSLKLSHISTFIDKKAAEFFLTVRHSGNSRLYINITVNRTYRKIDYQLPRFFPSKSKMPEGYNMLQETESFRKELS